MKTLKECLDLFDEVSRPEAIEIIQLDAQKHGEQIGWEKGMAEASEIAIKCISRQFSAHYHGASLIIRDSIIEARDKNQNKL